MAEKILVTGGAGAIGCHLVRELSQQHEVFVLDDLSAGFIENLENLPVRFWRASIVDEEILREVFSEHPTVVFHLAANFANQNSVDYPQKDLLVNGMGTLKLLQHAVDVGVKRFVYTSSSCVYGNADGESPLSESIKDYSLDTRYAVTKLLGEQYVQFFHDHLALPTVVLRLFNSYGPGEYPGKYRNVIPNFFYRTLTNKVLTITGTGDETRDFTFVSDTVAALLLAMGKEEAVGGVFNVGSGQQMAIRELAEKVQSVCDVKRPLEYQSRRVWDSVNRRCADITWARKVLGYEPTISLEQGLRLTHRWFLDRGIADRAIR